VKEKKKERREQENGEREGVTEGMEIVKEPGVRKWRWEIGRELKVNDRKLKQNEKELEREGERRREGCVGWVEGGGGG
jgi:hypothetical protein